MADKGFRLVAIQQVDVYAAVRSQLLQLIDSGAYQPGDKLPSERQLAEQLSVSRVAVREAMKVFEARGQVDIVHGSGTYLRSVQPDAIVDQLKPAGGFDSTFLDELVDLRLGIDLRVLELATANATPEDLDTLSELLERQASKRLSDLDTGTMNVGFEARLGELCGNSLLQSVQRSVHSLWVEGWAWLVLAPGASLSLHHEHAAILDAMRGGRVDEATQIMRQHVEQFRDASALEDRPTRKAT